MIKTNRACLLLPLLLMACQSPQKQASTPRTLLTQNVTTSSLTVQVNGQSLTSGVTLKPGDTITITLPPALPVVITPPPAPAPPPTSTPPAAGTWTALAKEAEKFTVPSPSTVRYGTGDAWNVKEGLTGTLTCGNALFGDPAVGKPSTASCSCPHCPSWWSRRPSTAR